MIDQAAPYLLILSAYLSATLFCLVVFVKLAVASNSMEANFRHVVIWSAVCLILQMILLGLPHHWSQLSLAGKLLAQGLGNAVVFSAAGLAISFAIRREFRAPRPTIAGVSVGVLAIAPSIIAVFFFTCAFTTDCL